MQESMIERRTIRMTPKMRSRLQQLVEKHPSTITEADHIRQAIREYLDRQEDIIGSRAHFRKSFQLRINDLEGDMTFQLHILINLLAHGLATMLPTFTEEAISVEELIQGAIIAAHKNVNTIQSQIDMVQNK